VPAARPLITGGVRTVGERGRSRRHTRIRCRCRPAV